MATEGVLKRIRAAFFAWGWLLPALLPYAQILGRAVFHILGVVYLMWAVSSLPGKKFASDRRPVLIYAIMVTAFFFSIIGAQDPLQGLGRWSEFLVYSTVPLFALTSMPHARSGVERLLDWLAVSAVIVLVTLYVMLAFKIGQPGFLPEYAMHEDNLPLLAPFLLYGLLYRCGSRLCRWAAFLLLIALFTYVVGSHGRAALVGLTAGLAAYLYFVVRWSPRRIALTAMALIAGAIVLRGEQFFHGAQRMGTFTDSLDVATSYRTALWRQALEHPPANPLLGVGMGNLSSRPDVMTVQVYGSNAVLKHLHNFLFDCWYETGLLGLASLLLWLGYLWREALRNWKTLPLESSRQTGVLLAAASAILASALLSYSYVSKQFDVYLFMFLMIAAARRPSSASP